ncbi:uncharacterized protein KGF55_004717 [Candida pseudojiufengensis]|uniref:uncharacterized protein n=1 Tax=Candida pseudojiufengensis TaxID=497109 RepID=UPI002224196D|nr:uncharacterized protein KGF55_004717 [Candida pseudojiufengensis]KAI5960425.1 hypothetical protein KGF55_004717 [Candida pseudojiufengensis]
MTNTNSKNLLILENDFNEIFGKRLINDEELNRNNGNQSDGHINNNDASNEESIIFRNSIPNLSSSTFSPTSTSSNSTNLNNFKLQNFENQNYEHVIKPSTKLIIKTSLAIFDQLNKNLLCIELFFSSYSNLKKLLVPFLKEQTQSLIINLKTIEGLLSCELIVDKMPTTKIQEKKDDGSVEASIQSKRINLINNLMEIERVTSGFEKESLKLKTAFFTFNTSLIQYTSLLLGKAILKRHVDQEQCEIIKRREICYQASEHVVSIPLTEDNKNIIDNTGNNYNHLNQNQNSMKSFGKILTYILMILMFLIVLVGYRLIKLLVGI